MEILLLSAYSFPQECILLPSSGNTCYINIKNKNNGCLVESSYNSGTQSKDVINVMKWKSSYFQYLIVGNADRNAQCFTYQPPVSV
jgi:hypothetical protein